MNDNHSLSHSKWNCKYHIVFAPKYRRQVVYGQLKADIGKILRTLCEQKKVNIIEAEACPDHIQMLSVYIHSGSTASACSALLRKAVKNFSFRQFAPIISAEYKSIIFTALFACVIKVTVKRSDECFTYVRIIQIIKKYLH